jgi:hypothetical protein
MSGHYQATKRGDALCDPMTIMASVQQAGIGWHWSSVMSAQSELSALAYSGPGYCGLSWRASDISQSNARSFFVKLQFNFVASSYCLFLEAKLQDHWRSRCARASVA